MSQGFCCHCSSLQASGCKKSALHGFSPYRKTSDFGEHSLCTTWRFTLCFGSGIATCYCNFEVQKVWTQLQRLGNFEGGGRKIVCKRKLWAFNWFFQDWKTAVCLCSFKSLNKNTNTPVFGRNAMKWPVPAWYLRLWWCNSGFPWAIGYVSKRTTSKIPFYSGKFLNHPNHCRNHHSHVTEYIYSCTPYRIIPRFSNNLENITLNAVANPPPKIHEFPC